MAGAVLFGLTYESVFPQISKLANYGNVVIPQLWNIDPYMTVLFMALFSLLLFYAVDRMGLQRKGD